MTLSQMGFSVHRRFSLLHSFAYVGMAKELQSAIVGAFEAKMAFGGNVLKRKMRLRTPSGLHAFSIANTRKKGNDSFIKSATGNVPVQR